MLQTGSLIEHLRVRELVTMVASLYPRPLEVDDALALSGSSDLADRWTTKLSGGQTQRVRFAIALVANPDLLLLDEPTAALDVEARRDFWSSMRDVAARGKTVIFATHYLEEADAFADRIVLLGQRDRRRRRTAQRDQVQGRRADDPGDAARRRSRRAPRR